MLEGLVCWIDDVEGLGYFEDCLLGGMNPTDLLLAWTSPDSVMQIWVLECLNFLGSLFRLYKLQFRSIFSGCVSLVCSCKRFIVVPG